MTLLLAGLVLLPVLILFLKYSALRVPKLPPGPNAWVFLRNLSQFRKRPHVAFGNLAKIYGPLMSLRLGGQLVVVASSSEIAKEILKTHDRNFSGRYLPSIYYKVPQAINSSLAMASECNDSWKFLRAIGQNFIFSTKSVDSKAQLRKAKVAEMVDYLQTKESAVVQVDDLINVTVTNIISNILVSRDLFSIRGDKVASHDDEKVKAFVNEIIEMAADLGLADLFPILKGVDFWSNGKGMDIYQRIMYIWKDMVKERRARKDEGATNNIQDFLDVLLQNGLSDDQISLVSMEMLSAGGDATTITSVWLMVELIRHQDVLQRVRDEVAKAFQGEELVNESVLCECKYLQACVNETLRFHLPGPLFIPHRAIETCAINNYLIPKDTVVLVNAWAIARESESWKNANKFKPERFLDSNVDYKGTHFEFLPFGAGRRMCPGSVVALRNIKVIVGSLIHYFDWSLPNGADPMTIDVSDKFGTTLKKEKPLYLIPMPREHYKKI